MKIVLAEDGDSKAWDDYIYAHPDGCVFQATAWRDVVESTYSHRPFYLIAKQDSEIRGVLPIFLFVSRLFGRVMATTPYASSGAICANDDETAHELVRKAIEIARENGVKYLELKSRSMTKCTGLQRHTDYSNYSMPIDEPQVMWRSRLKKKTRESVKHSEKFGLTFEKGPQLLDDFYKVMVASMRRLGTPVHSKAFYQNIMTSFGSNANIFAVKYKDVPVTLSLMLRYRQELAALSRVSLEEYYHLRPNNFLFWEIFKDAYSSGVTSIDLGRSLAGSGPAIFKESWGAEAKPLYYEYFLNLQKTVPKINQENHSYDLPRKIWKHIPLSLTKLLGPHLIKNIP